MEAIFSLFQTAMSRLVWGIWSSVLSLAGLWLFSLFCLSIMERFPQFRQKLSAMQELQQTLEAKKQLARQKQLPKVTKTVAPNFANAEEFVKLFEAWLCAEGVEKGTLQSVSDYVKKLQDSGKELQRIHLIIESFQMKRRLWRESYDAHLNKEAVRIEQLTERFEYVKINVDMRLLLLKTCLTLMQKSNTLQKQVMVWVNETQALQEKLHALPCDADDAIERQLEKQKTITKEAREMDTKMHTYQQTVSEITALLQEIATWTEKFRQTVSQKHVQNGNVPWHALLIGSLEEEMARVKQQFMAVRKLTDCYAMHLADLRLLSHQGEVAQRHRRRPSEISEMFHSMMEQVGQKTASFKLKKSLKSAS